MAHKTVHTSNDRAGRQMARMLLGACVAALAVVAGSGTPAWAGTSSGTVAAGCQAYAGDPSGPPIGPVANQPSVTATFTHPDSATAETPFDVSVDLSGWMNSVIAVDGSGTELVLTLGLTGATQSSVDATVGPPGPGAAANEEFSVPTATVSITPAGGGPVTVTLDRWAVNNSPVNVYVECTIQSGSASAEIPVDGGAAATTAPPATTAPSNDGATPTTAPPNGATATTAPSVDSSAATTGSSSTGGSGQLAASGFDSNTLVLIGAVLCVVGLVVVGPGLRRRLRHGD